MKRRRSNPIRSAESIEREMDMFSLWDHMSRYSAKHGSTALIAAIVVELAEANCDDAPPEFHREKRIIELAKEIVGEKK